MMKVNALAAVLALCLAGPLSACDKEAKLTVAGAEKSGCCKAKMQAAVAQVMKTLPTMTYKVADKETNCPEEAAKLAGVEGKVQYVVAQKAYDNETEAVSALAEALEKEVENLKTVQFAVGEQRFGCPMAARAACKDGQQVKYRLAGFEFNSMDKADAARKAIDVALNGGSPEGAAKVGCDKPCAKGEAAQTAGAEKKEGSPCHKRAAAVASADSNTEKAQVAGAEGSPCHKGAAVAAAQKAGAEGSPCQKGVKAAVAGAEEKSGCCAKAKERLAAVEAKIQTIVATAAGTATASDAS